MTLFLREATNAKNLATLLPLVSPATERRLCLCTDDRVVPDLVEEGSIRREADGLTVRFAITDTAKVIPVAYRGMLPDLFKEGKGAVVQGRLEADGTFRASEVLAKHDENYMPPEAAHAVEQAHKAATTVSQ